MAATPSTNPSTNPRTLVAGLGLSAMALVGLALSEGYTDRAVRPLPGDVPTIGFGSTRRPDGSPVQLADRTTPPAALAQKLRDVGAVEARLRQCLTAPLTQGEWDSAVLLAYNVGADAVCRSTLVRLHNEGRHAEACAQFERWTFFQGKDCRQPANRCGGLVRRRIEERAVCESAQQGRAPQ